MKLLSGFISGGIFGVLGLIIGLFIWDYYWFVVLGFVVLGFLFGVAISADMENKSIENQKNKKIASERLAQGKARVKELTENQYGKPVIERNSFSNDNSFSVHEESKVVLINQKAIPYSNIRACELLVDGQTSTSTTSTITKSSTGSVVGRAVVGTVVAGGAGAVIGGLSGKKTGIGETTTSVITNYSVRISTNNIAEPTKIIRCNNDIVFATNLVDTLNIIIERPDKNEPPNKIVNLEKRNGSNEQNSVVDLKLLSEKLSKFQEVDRLNEFSN